MHPHYNHPSLLGPVDGSNGDQNTNTDNINVHGQQNVSRGAMLAHVLATSLANPYGSASHANANYAAYFTQAQRPLTTVHGYTISSTYVPDTGGPSHSHPRPQRGRPPTSTHQPTPHISRPSSHDQSQYPYSIPQKNKPQFFQQNTRPFPQQTPFNGPGATKCTYEQCTFTGSQKSVEIHMMDRHLIYPPGWKRKTDDWDADPSLKGKPVPIPGTGVLLNTPEAIDAWIAERKKRWPSKDNVESKKRKAQEAADRGEIDPSQLTSKNRKRQKTDDGTKPYDGQGRGHSRGRGRGRGRGGSAVTREDYNRTRQDSGWRGRGRGRGGVNGSVHGSENPHASNHKVDALGLSVQSDEAPSSSDSDSQSNPDMDPIKDAVSSKSKSYNSKSEDVLSPQISERHLSGNDCRPCLEITANVKYSATQDLSTQTDAFEYEARPVRKRKPVLQPKTLVRNPFSTRSSLLRNLLLPEIRHTVSNLSQAIHFLVENDFLEGVELRPGEADSQRIKVLESVRFTDLDAPEVSMAYVDST